jgi:hypothetical protein
MTMAFRQRLVASWAVGAVTLMMLDAMFRLGHRAALAFEGPAGPLHWAACAASVAFFCYVEGHRALQKKFAPMVVSRAVTSGAQATGGLAVLTAPLYAMGLCGGAPREVARAWSGALLIVAAVVVVRSLPAPWREVVDSGVAAALGWGAVALLATFVRAMRRAAC